MKYQDILRHYNSCTVIIDVKGGIKYINPKAESILDCDAVEDVSKNIRSILPIKESVLLDFLEGKVQKCGCHVYVRNTSFSVDLFPIFSAAKFIGGVCCFKEVCNPEHSTDKTESYRAINRQLEAIIASSSDGIWVCDGTGEVIRVNKASETLNGIKAEKVVGNNIQDLLDNKVFDQSVTSQVMATREQETILQYVAKTNKHLLVTGSPVIDDSGNTVLIVVNERDITELNSLRKRFEQSQKVSEKYKEELSELALRELEQNTLVADSSKMRNILQMSLKLAHIGASNILILGESGTGKSMLSKLIHKNSNRWKNAFVEINCAALPDSLLEAELFGYEKGAFTGANPRGKVGLFEMAHNGTLFLDEIGDMPLHLQAKLLKYLDNNEIRRVGGTETIQVECSVVAATNQNLKELVQQKLFREDLYYRLNSFTLNIPPLRDRAEDISSLVRYYLKKFNGKYSSSKKIGSKAMQTLLNYSFPGNVRELKGIIENSVVMSDSSHVDQFVEVSLGESPSMASNQENVQPFFEGYNLPKSLKMVERRLLVQAKEQCVTTREMAKHLGISQPSVVRKLKEHSISSL